jgi:diaminopimelate decarboxylase
VVFNSSIRYIENELYIDDICVADIVTEIGTPTYVYSLKRAVQNYHQLLSAFSDLDIHIHYSAKANSNLAVLKALSDAGAGIDTVSMGEIYRALHVGVQPKYIVFAGVGKTPQEIRYALEQGIGWFNVENVLELDHIQSIAEELNVASIRVALRLNPQVTANTHPYISTGHGGAKFGLTAEVIEDILTRQSDYSRISFEGIHIHIGSQLGDTNATLEAVEAVLNLIQPYPIIRYINMGGGLPTAYHFDEDIPSIEAFAKSLVPLLKDYTILLEPGRSVIADAGILVAEVQYVKQQAGQTFYIVDGSMAELIRPSLYQAHHEIVPLNKSNGEMTIGHIVGPICETADVLAKDRELPDLNVGDKIAVMTVGAYGMVMASNYNARLRPAEIVVTVDGKSWSIARQRETLDDLLRYETEALK